MKGQIQDHSNLEGFYQRKLTVSDSLHRHVWGTFAFRQVNVLWFHLAHRQIPRKGHFRNDHGGCLFPNEILSVCYLRMSY